MTYQEHRFAHHGCSFTVETDEWPSVETASAAAIDLQTWTMGLDPARTAALHEALWREREALIHDLEYDRNQAPLQDVRLAQRNAVRSGLGTVPAGKNRPTVTLEASQS